MNFGGSGGAANLGLGGGAGGYGGLGGGGLGGGGLGGGGGGGWSATTIAAVSCCVVLLCVAIYFVCIRKNMTTPRNGAPSIADTPIATTDPPGGEGAGGKGQKKGSDEFDLPEGVTEEGQQQPTEDTEYFEFAFEPHGMPGHVPDITAKMVRKPPANPVYRFIKCGGGGRYAIRWQGKFLTVNANGTCSWENVQNSDTCFQQVVGHCAEDKYAMLRSMSNKQFLRVDTANGNALVAKDSPTQRTAYLYCWKLQSKRDVSPVPCGCQFDNSIGSVVCRPCATPSPAPGLVVDAANSRKSSWPELIGVRVDQAVATLRAQTGAKIKVFTSTSQQQAMALSIQHPGSVHVVYDARTMVVQTAPFYL